MARTPVDRELNKAGHRYAFDSLSRTHICEDCGVSEHRNGQFWLWGKWSKTEPPCTGDHLGQRDWYEQANEDKGNM